MKRLNIPVILLMAVSVFFIVGCTSRTQNVALDTAQNFIPPPSEIVPPSTTITSIPQPTTAPMSPSITSLPHVSTALLSNPGFNSRYAQTDTHLFMTYVSVMPTEGYGLLWTHALYRLPLDNIALGEAIPLPGDSTINIIGLCTRYLYISRRTWQGWADDAWQQLYMVYKIALDTLEASEIVQINGFVAPFYHEASHSVLAVTGSAHHLPLHLASYCLQTNEWLHLYEIIPYFEGGGMDWIQMEMVP
ncbi:MAG: hypothetical protein FWC71_10915 [Defluviitaleaceae bacterium]|nr:hypothetical protein [Defluviitaleaceae bacterium]